MQNNSSGGPWLSVIMPVYQAARYLKKAARSVLEQAMDDLELILIDDCSSDGSGAICGDLARGDTRVRAVHLSENTGLSRARNAGLALCRGKYAAFMDSDDCIDADLYKNVRAAAVGRETPMIVLGAIEEHYAKEDRLKRAVRIVPDEFYAATAQEARSRVMPLEERTLFGYAWNKLYRVDFLRNNNLEFQDVPLIEDVLFNIAAMRAIDELLILPIAGYRYARRAEESLTKRFIPDYFLLNERRIRELYALHSDWGMNEYAARRGLGCRYARYLISALMRNCDPRMGMDHSARREWVRAAFNSELFADLDRAIRAERGSPMRLPAFAIRRRYAWACLIMGRAAYWLLHKNGVSI